LSARTANPLANVAAEAGQASELAVRALNRRLRNDMITGHLCSREKS